MEFAHDNFRLAPPVFLLVVLVLVLVLAFHLLLRLGAADIMPENDTGAVAHGGREALRDIACGSVAGMCGKLIEYPADTSYVWPPSAPTRVARPPISQCPADACSLGDLFLP